MSLCEWCRENTFGPTTLYSLTRACTGQLHKAVVQHMMDQEPFYFWTSRPWHSGFEISFHRPFQSVNTSAEEGCIFCSLLVAAARRNPPQHPDQCYFDGPMSLFPEIRDVVKATTERQALTDIRVQRFFDNLDPQWRQKFTYATVMSFAIEAGMPRESLLLSYKFNPGNERRTDFRVEYAFGNPVIPLWPLPPNPCRGLPEPNSQYTGPVREEKSSSSDSTDFDFMFTLLLNEPWDFGTVVWTYRPSGPDWGIAKGNCYFRLYPVGPEENSEGHEATTSDETFRHVRDIWDASRAQPSLMAPLTRDGNILAALLEDCVANHGSCINRHDIILPSMLLHVSGTITSPFVNLVNTNMVLKRPIRYACLSYCWGGDQENMTTLSRLSTYKKSIGLHLMAKTPQDAVKVALSMGLKYLWIDAYCIVQDSVQDKILELSKMSSIYQGAYCTIAAMSAEAATEGFLERNAGAIWTVDIESKFDQKGTCSPRVAVLEMRQDFEKPSPFDEPLGRRAWTLQEALLSPRLILYFSKGQPPVLRCSSRTMRTDGTFVPQIPQSVTPLYSVMTVPSNPEEISAYRRLWQMIVQEYSKRKLTRSEDKLPALSGIVAELEVRGTLGEYHAGLWSKTINHDLLWTAQGRDSLFLAREETEKRSAYSEYVGPSWSWVSRNHSVFYQSKFFTEREITVTSISTEPRQAALPNGIINTAKITLRCPAKKIDVPDDWNHAERSFVFDDEPRLQAIGGMWLLAIMAEEPYNDTHVVGIGVIEVREKGTEEKLYKRVGMFQNGCLEDSDRLTWNYYTFIII